MYMMHCHDYIDMFIPLTVLELNFILKGIFVGR
jgi:hypothetical protein